MTSTLRCTGRDVVTLNFSHIKGIRRTTTIATPWGSPFFRLPSLYRLFLAIRGEIIEEQPSSAIKKKWSEARLAGPSPQQPKFYP